MFRCVAKKLVLFLVLSTTSLLGDLFWEFSLSHPVSYCTLSGCKTIIDYKTISFLKSSPCGRYLAVITRPNRQGLSFLTIYDLRKRRCEFTAHLHIRIDNFAWSAQSNYFAYTYRRPRSAPIIKVYPFPTRYDIPEIMLNYSSPISQLRWTREQCLDTRSHAMVQCETNVLTCHFSNETRKSFVINNENQLIGSTPSQLPLEITQGISPDGCLTADLQNGTVTVSKNHSSDQCAVYKPRDKTNPITAFEWIYANTDMLSLDYLNDDPEKILLFALGFADGTVKIMRFDQPMQQIAPKAQLGLSPLTIFV